MEGVYDTYNRFFIRGKKVKRAGAETAGKYEKPKRSASVNWRFLTGIRFRQTHGEYFLPEYPFFHKCPPLDWTFEEMEEAVKAVVGDKK